MQAQKCKVCGERHHRYEPHQFPQVPSQASQADRSNVRSPSRRIQDTDKAGLPFLSRPEHAPTPAVSLHTSDTAPSLKPLVLMVPGMLERLRELSDEDFRVVYNAVSAERMRRWRLKKQAATS